MSAPIRKITRTRPNGNRRFQLFEMYEWQIQFDESALHLDLLKERDYHNAYDADDKNTLFRADALFKHGNETFRVPVFAAKQRPAKGRPAVWRWLLRFRPHRTGAWQCLLYVLHWHPKAHSKGEPKGSKRKDKLNNQTFYEHEHGPDKLFDFNVGPSALPGPIECAHADKKDNANYLYRVENGNRAPFFLLGSARPWVTRSGEEKRNEKWDSFLLRDKELFQRMAAARCNVLYHWMSPNETQLVHQCKYEYWFDRKSKHFKGYDPAARTFVSSTQDYPGEKFPDDTAALAYRRFDQGRAAHTDEIMDAADVGKNRHVQLIVAIMPHGLLQDGQTVPDRQKKPKKRYGHHWGEWGWREQHPNRKHLDKSKNPKRYLDIPGKLNGFHFFKAGAKNISVKQFFEMDPTASSARWRRQLWNHFANYLRYIVARWTAHPALGAWVLMDELEGVGTSSTWWWENKPLTYVWHDRILWLLRGKMNWTRHGKKLPYTGDYLQHPQTTSTTHYEGSSPWTYVSERYKQLQAGGVPAQQTQGALAKHKAIADFRKNGAQEDALFLIDTLADIADHGTWIQGTRSAIDPRGGVKNDFVSHHAYQAVPTWGVWCTEKATGKRDYISTLAYSLNRAKYKEVEELKKLGQKNGPSLFELVLPNQELTARIEPNCWLWDSLCMRLRSWTRANRHANGAVPLLITEYGCVERDWPGDDWDHYGKRTPSFSHFANWAALALGHCGIPLKWNDGEEHGEMAYREPTKLNPPVNPLLPWSKKNYPVDIYADIEAMATFMQGAPLHALRHRAELDVVDAKGATIRYFSTKRRYNPPRYNAWAITDRRETLIAWLYDRRFSTKGKAHKQSLQLHAKMLLHPDCAYKCVWYSPWTGEPLRGKDAAVVARTDKNGTLRLPLVQFPKNRNRAHFKSVNGVSDGNDVALKITRK